MKKTNIYEFSPVVYPFSIYITKEFDEEALKNDSWCLMVKTRVKRKNLLLHTGIQRRVSYGYNNAKAAK